MTDSVTPFSVFRCVIGLVTACLIRLPICAAMLLVACGGAISPQIASQPSPVGTLGEAGRTTSPPDLIPPEASSWLSRIENYDAGIQLIPPPAGAVPVHSAADAYAACITHVAPCGHGQPTEQLAAFSDYQSGSIQPDGTVKHPYMGLLVWAITWHQQTCFVSGPAPAPGGTQAPRTPAGTVCDLVDFIDATTGNYLMAYTGPPPH